MPDVAPRVPGVEARAGKFPGPSLIPALHAIQERVGWLPREELVALSRDVRRPLYEIEGLISFYPHFRTTPPERVTLRVCHDLSCWLRGADGGLARLRARYGPGAGAGVEVIEGSCLGRCDTAPAAAVNEVPVPLSGVDALVSATRDGAARDGAARDGAARDGAARDGAARDGGVSPGAVPSAGRRWPNDPYTSEPEHYGVLRDVLSGALEPGQVTAALADSGLRGMGGAGFPAGRKWELVAAQAATPKYAICNADESEPGTFKDRQILADQPHLVLEGLLLGMLATGAEEGWVFIRHEYGPEEAAVRQEIDRLRAAGLMGPDVLGTGRRLSVEVFTSPGGYILGEESALIECMEGHRGEPRNKPPFPGVYGLHGQPTLMNSVETFAHVPVIARRGAAWWTAQGAGEHAGLKFFAVSGHVERPGVYCVPMGTTARGLLEQAGGVSGGRRLGAIQPGGASSNFLGPDQLDVPLDFGSLREAGSMLGSGALVVLAEGTDLLAAATNVLRFFRDESCGKCVPCRVGSTKAHQILADHLAAGGGPAGLDGRIGELEQVMRRTSICGLGQVALGPVASVLRLSGGPDTR
jgi:NADH:ubiquinone oxidoreductase subunit F (NADH-binding)/NADH:ubiquinone oxidoreductase subunit E